MATQLQSDSNEMVTVLARCRYGMLERANALLNATTASARPDQTDEVRDIASLLLTALEELKVAEEELRAQNARLEEQRADVDECVRYFRQLFLYTPAPAIITDVYASIRDVNLAAARLLRRDAEHLDRKPMAALMPLDCREEFRRQLARAAVADDVRDWRITLNRTGDLPVELQAHVSLVPGVGETGRGMLFWLLRAADTPN